MSNIYYIPLNAHIFAHIFTLYTPEKATKIVSSTIFIHSLFIDSIWRSWQQANLLCV